MRESHPNEAALSAAHLSLEVGADGLAGRNPHKV